MNHPRPRWSCIAIAALLVPLVSARAQANRQTACSFDTTAHTDTLSLQFAIRVFRDGDDKPDAALTRAVGDAMRGSFRPTASIGGLFSPNTYFAQKGKQHFSQVLGLFRLLIQVDGSTSGRWRYPMADSETQIAVNTAVWEPASTDGFRQLMASHGWRKPEAVLLQFVALTDDILADQAPLLRVRVPMIRIEGDSVDQVFLKGKPQTLHPLRGYDNLRNDGVWRLVIDESGHLTLGGPEVEFVIARGSSTTIIRNGIAFAPARVGGCPVPFALPTGVNPRP